jgi:cytochrome c-type biogenesis protein CcmH
VTATSEAGAATGVTAPADTAAADRELAKATTRRRRLASYAAMALVLVVALVIGANAQGPASDNERVQALASSLACPECDGQSIAESDAPIARELYADIGRRVDDGETDDQIRDFYRNRWGEAVLLTPAAGGVSGLVWILPVVALAVAVAALTMAFAKWRQRVPDELTDADAGLVAEARSR